MNFQNSFEKMMAAAESGKKNNMKSQKYESPKSNITPEMYTHFREDCDGCDFCNLMDSIEEEGFCLDPNCACSRTFGVLNDVNESLYLRRLHKSWDALKR